METLVQQLIKAFGWSIINSLWQSALIYGILFIVLFSFPKLAAKHKHNIAFGSIVLMFLSFSYNFGDQMIKGLQSQQARFTDQNLEIYHYLNNLPESFSSKAEQYFPLIVGFYLLGIFLQLFVISKGYRQLNKLKKENLSEVPSAWVSIFKRVTTNLNIKKTVGFQISSMVNVPLVLGYLKPVVLFPLTLVNQLDADQVEAILIHELSHIRRNDFLLNLIKTAIETILFFNPFVWMAGRFIHIEREHACDDLVLKLTQKPLNYAHALLKLELLKDKTSPAYALAATGKTQNLYQRIKRITNMKTNYLNAKQQMAALTLGIACLFSIAWISPAKKEVPAKASENALLETAPILQKLTPVVLADTTKKKVKIITVDANGKKTEYNSIKDLPDSLKKTIYNEESGLTKNYIYLTKDSGNFFHYVGDTLKFAELQKKFESPEWKAQMAKVRKNAEEIAKKYDSPEWKANMARIQKNAEEIAKKYDSPEWKANMAQIQKNAEVIAKQYDSPEWKANIARIQKNAEEIAKKYDSPEWKANMEQVQKNAERMAKIYESPEWKANIARIQKNAEEIAKKYDSPEWKANMAKIQKNAEEISKKYNSPEWKANMDRIQKNAEEIKKKYDSPEWKQKIKEYRELQDSPEYKELQKKYEQDLDELKKKKGMKTDKTYLLFDSNQEMKTAYLPLTKSDPKLLYISEPDLKLNSQALKLIKPLLPINESQRNLMLTPVKP